MGPRGLLGGEGKFIFSRIVKDLEGYGEESSTEFAGKVGCKERGQHRVSSTDTEVDRGS